MSARQQVRHADEKPFSADLEMVDVGTHRLALVSSGTGSPPVILETGLGAESSEWAAIQEDVSALTRVIRYDRANRGWSDSVPGPRTARDMVEDLRLFLRAAGVATPCVLVGHSFGGLLVRLYAHLYRHEVAGLVLVDPMHQDQFDVFAPLFPPVQPSDAPELVKVRAFWQGGWRSTDSTAERINFASSISQAREITSLGDIPVHIIIAGTFLQQPLVPAQARGKLQERWQQQKMELLSLSKHATFSLVPESGHFVQRDAPQAVSDAIKSMLGAIRRAKTE